jgi:hypothetical protein
MSRPSARKSRSERDVREGIGCTRARDGDLRRGSRSILQCRPDL